MSQQPQQKALNKRTGKRITFFSDPQAHPVTSKEQQLKEQQLYGTVSRLPITQAPELTKSNTYSAAPNNMMNTVMYTQERPDGMRINQQPVPGKWNVGDRNEATWAAQQANMWQRNASGYPMQIVPSYYNHHEPIKRSQDKGVGVSQMDMYENTLQQMMSQKTPLEQHQLAQQQAHLNSILQAQQQQQQQQQQHQQNQHLALQSFQVAFGNQGQKTNLQSLFHVFPDTQSNAVYAAQQKQTALPKMQLFENLYPLQQQQQAVYGMQQGVPQNLHAASQQKMHVMNQPQRVPTSEEYMKALAEQSQQSVLPKAQIPLPRRSRRLSKEGPEPLPPNVGQSNNPYAHHPYEQAMQHQLAVQERYKQMVSRDVQETQHVNRLDTDQAALPHNGRTREVQVAEQNSMGPIQPAGGGAVTVIQSTRRRRRISQEANLFTLAQKAAEMPSLENTKDSENVQEKNETLKSNAEIAGASSPKKSRGEGELRPLVMPVSVPVKIDAGREKGDDERTQRAVTSERLPSASMPSVIVTRHRAGHTGVSDPTVQNNETSSLSETVSRKPKQRPRPEPLFIPPKPGTFVVPVYTNITPYQSHLRSPVRVPEHPCDKNFELPPYTPPPILSPVREGSGLYFNAIISANTHSMPPPITPKSSTRTLLRSNSGEDMPPLLTAEATPVSLEPRINIGARFQADIPDYRDRSLAFADKYKADMVWCPSDDLGDQQAVEELLTAACSSILPGGGTNQELALHYLHESKGNILAALTKLLLKKPKRHKGHHLENYHYSGSDNWSVTERRLFNKGMAIYKKDFLLVQKLIKTKTVAQCVEFYYTYKKQVKIGRNGMLIFGDVEAAADEKNPREDSEIDIKSSQRVGPGIPPQNTDDNDAEMENNVHAAMEEEDERSRVSSQMKVTQTLQASEISNDMLILRNQNVDMSLTAKTPKPRGRRPRASIPADEAKKPENTNKAPAQEGTFPCKKCGRVFYKVKSRSAHMKSHAEQEKKAAALKQSEAAAAAAARAQALHARSRLVESSDSGSSSDSDSITSSSSESCDSSDDGEI